MSKDKKVLIGKENCIWYITLLSNHVTFFSNGFYLDINLENKEKIEGSEKMVKWEFKKKDNEYYFITTRKNDNNILSIENNELKVNKSKVEKTELFQLIDVPEDNNKISFKPNNSSKELQDSSDDDNNRSKSSSNQIDSSFIEISDIK